MPEVSVAPRVEIVVPLFRELDSLDRLFAALAETLPGLEHASVVFVDDGSGDGTAEACAEKLHSCSFSARLLRHRRNLGLSAALRTAFLGSDPSTDIHCWLDADLSYDPAILLPLVEAVCQGADVALASAYHPCGSVESVPPLRLLLSKGLSRAYGLLRGRQPFTWSCMVRAWRRQALARCLPERDAHLGVTESLLRAHEAGMRIIEVPATLRGRVTGASGLKLLPGVLGQLRLMRDATTGGLGGSA